MASSGEPGVMPSPGAAIWMPTRQPIPGSVCSEKASSISVVAASSIEKAATSARGRSVGKDGNSMAGNSVPAGK